VTRTLLSNPHTQYTPVNNRLIHNEGKELRTDPKGRSLPLRPQGVLRRRMQLHNHPVRPNEHAPARALTTTKRRTPVHQTTRAKPRVARPTLRRVHMCSLSTLASPPRRARRGSWHRGARRIRLDIPGRVMASSSVRGRFSAAIWVLGSRDRRTSVWSPGGLFSRYQRAHAEGGECEEGGQRV
jgi:hypothetical protein